jgi:nucleoside-diphosphate-sugar epimerase
MRVVVIGGSGHVGTFLVPRLVEAGHEVVSISRGQREPYQVHPAWQSVEQVTLDREAEEAEGTFGKRVLGLEPDAVVDMICFTPESARQLVDALRGRISHFLHCGTIWVHGHSTKVPTTEDQTRRPFGDYGVQKARIEAYLLDEARRGGFPATVLHPGHIVGPGWAPVNPAGNFDLTVFERLARGRNWPSPTSGWRRCITSTPTT